MQLFKMLFIFLLLSSSLIGAEAQKKSEPIKIKGFHYTLQVKNLKKAQVYYEIVFGMKPGYQLKGEVGFVLVNGFSINLEEKKKVQKTSSLTIAVSGIKKLFSGFKKNKVWIEQKPSLAADGHAIVGIIKDVDGNTISFAEGVKKMKDVQESKGTEIKLEIYIKADPKKIFNALTDGKELIKWWDFEEATIERKVGGKVILKGKDGFGLNSTVQQYEQDKLISYGFYGGDEEPVAYHVSKKDDGAQLKLIHRFPKGSPMGTGENNKMIEKEWKAILKDLKAWAEKK